MLWAIIEGKLNVWEKEIPDRHFEAKRREQSLVIGNLAGVDTEWDVTSNYSRGNAPLTTRANVGSCIDNLAAFRKL
jgi:hypothetical protein